MRCVGIEPKVSEGRRGAIACWKRPVCLHCVSINDFLDDPAQMQSQQYLLSAKDYMHMEPQLMQLEKSDFEVSVQIEGTFRLVNLVKTRRQYKAKHALWAAKKERAQEELRSFGKDTLLKLLAGEFDAITRMRCIRLPTKATNSTVTLANTTTLQKDRDGPRINTKPTADPQPRSIQTMAASSRATRDAKNNLFPRRMRRKKSRIHKNVRQNPNSPK
jgi:hypothetical protein